MTSDKKKKKKKETAHCGSNSKWTINTVGKERYNKSFQMKEQIMLSHGCFSVRGNKQF